MTVLFLHAFPFDPRMWERQLALAPDAEAPLLYELGESMDEWARSILDRYEGELVLVGASMGGYLAYHVARLAPERVRGLLTEGARAQADAPGGRARRDELIRLTEEQGPEALWEAMRPVAFSADADDELLDRARGWVLEQRPEHAIRALRVMRDRRDTTDILKLLDPHPAIVLGDLDTIARAGDFVGVVLPEAVRTIRGCGHMPNLERPDAFDPILEELLDRWTR
ncbi:MAG TPA: alpha/beta hydrolase [Gaiellaceae bacterium]|nr:alpha/beta hydrolase [Gaiellaceae bacterium]